MRRWVQGLCLTLALIGPSSSALAQGRAACRVEFGTSTRLFCYADQSLYTIGPVESYAGMELRYPGPEFTPYLGILYRAEGWWGAAEVARPLVPPWRGGETGWGFRVLFGLTWGGGP